MNGEHYLLASSNILDQDMGDISLFLVTQA